LVQVQRAKVLLLGAGRGTRWQHYLGVQKYMVPVDGVPLLENTVSRLRENGLTDIELLVAHDHDVSASCDVKHIQPWPTGLDSDKLMSSRQHWNSEGPTLLLYADVYFSDCALQEMVHDPQNFVRFIGRNRESSFTGCDHGEIFAIGFGPQQHGFLEGVLATFGSNERKPVGWQLYKRLLQTNMMPEQPNLSFVHIDDFTEDFDTPKDYDVWLERWTDKPNAFRARRRVREHRFLFFGVMIGMVVTIVGALAVNLLF
jgi:hypothetical protein